MSANYSAVTQVFSNFSQLPEPFLDNDSDICLIVKDLEKGWKVDHEPTIHHYQELLQTKKVSCISEVPGILCFYFNYSV